MEGFLYKGDRWKRQKELMDKIDKKPTKPSHIISEAELTSKEYEDLFKDCMSGKSLLTDEEL